MAGNDSEGLYYGAIKAPEQFWLKWKDKAGDPCNEPKFNTKRNPQARPVVRRSVTHG
jgi:hypothetical protein